MKIVENVKTIKEIHPNSIVFVRVGKFYNVYGKDSYIISNLFNYKLNKIGTYYTSGFPIAAINKVLKTIEYKNISYIAVNRSNNYEVEERQEYKENKYEEYYEKSAKKIKLKNRINLIKLFLDEIEENEQMLYKLKQIEEIMHEE